jgi:two-component system chemotaxis response regulator CheY
MKVLVVDDELVSRKKMEKIMTTFGQCVAVENGADALKEFEEAIGKGEGFDLITLDVSMPGMDGTEVLFEIRMTEQQKNIPKENKVKVIMVTGQSDKDLVITCMQAGCDGYVVKPFDSAIMAAKIKQIGINVPETA